MHTGMEKYDDQGNEFIPLHIQAWDSGEMK